MRIFNAIFIVISFFLLAHGPVMAKTSPIGHLVLAWHDNAHELWIGRGTNGTTLEAAVLKRCNLVMGSGCSLASSVSSGFVAIARRADGILMTGRGDSAAAAERSALDFCTQSGLYCDLEEIFDVPLKATKATFRDPRDKKYLVRRYGAVIWQQPATHPTRLWIATGRASASLAVSDALAKCKADVGEGCAMAQWGANTTLVAYLDGKGMLRTIQGKNLEHALFQQERFCRENKLTCTTKMVANSAATATFVQNISR